MSVDHEGEYDDERLVRYLKAAQTRGFVGKANLENHLRHSKAFNEAIDALSQGPILRIGDIGSGGGIPGIMIAQYRQNVEVTLIESSRRRANFLLESGKILDLAVVVVHSSAESLGVNSKYRESFDIVTSRLFGPLSVTLECSSPLVKVGGMIVVSSKSTHEGLQNEYWLGELGLAIPKRISIESNFFDGYLKVTKCKQEYPRDSSITRKKLLFDVSRETFS